MHDALNRIRQAARKDKGLRFTTLWHHVYDIRRLREAYSSLKKDASAGVDGQTWLQYGQDLDSNLSDLSSRLRRGAYRALNAKQRVTSAGETRWRHGSQDPNLLILGIQNSNACEVGPLQGQPELAKARTGVNKR